MTAVVYEAQGWWFPSLHVLWTFSQRLLWLTLPLQTCIYPPCPPVDLSLVQNFTFYPADTSNLNSNKCSAPAHSQTNCRWLNEGNTHLLNGVNVCGFPGIMRCNEEGMEKKAKKVIGSFNWRRNEELISLNVSGDGSKVAVRCRESNGLQKN